MRRLRFEQWVLLFVVVVGAVSSSVIGLATLHNSQEGATAHRALCGERVNLDNRIRRTQRFLDKHPHGIPGIPTALIQAGLHDDRTQRGTLAALHC